MKVVAYTSFVIVLVLLIIWSQPLLGLSQPSEATNYDHNWLTLTWPPSYCTKTTRANCKEIPTVFVIHGLWPVDASGVTLKPHPAPWVDVKALMEENDGLYKRMLEHWLCLEAPKNNKTGQCLWWEHEWLAHGVSQDKEIQPYFEAALDLKESIDILGILQQGGIVPGNRDYPRSVWESALEPRFGTKAVGFRCSHDTSSDTYWMTEMRICVDGTATRFIECPSEQEVKLKMRDNCKGDIIWFA